MAWFFVAIFAVAAIGYLMMAVEWLFDRISTLIGTRALLIGLAFGIVQFVALSNRRG